VPDFIQISRNSAELTRYIEIFKMAAILPIRHHEFLQFETVDGSMNKGIHMNSACID